LHLIDGQGPPTSDEVLIHPPPCSDLNEMMAVTEMGNNYLRDFEVEVNHALVAHQIISACPAPKAARSTPISWFSRHMLATSDHFEREIKPREPTEAAGRTAMNEVDKATQPRCSSARRRVEVHLLLGGCGSTPQRSLHPDLGVFVRCCDQDRGTPIMILALLQE
jgi:hypothetical protein